ncbi:tyrosyl-tRNA synthetase [Blyttiomyces sp. JEL0837]|nr:tyrosyl-tRNA synthetase [Blyttiomyces sp. JEL0837]
MTSPSDSIIHHLKKSPTSVYAGFDPTAKSLHAGNLLTIIALLHFQVHGHTPIALVGGATGSIGDPSGRSTERNALPDSLVHENSACIRHQLETVFRNAEAHIKRHQPNIDEVPALHVLDNLSWFGGIGVLEFVRDVGKYVRVSAMLAKESVKSRLDSPDGISFTEFSYQLFQAFDFYHLWKNHNCTIQLGGSDQWGNITTGIDLIKKKELALASCAVDGDARIVNNAFGVTLPLITTATGEKFGKSAGNAVWLDSEMCSTFDFYQFFRRTPDSEVEKHLKSFTFLPLESIHSIMHHHKAKPGDHLPQRTLAFEVTDLVHGHKTAVKCRTMSTVLFDGDSMEGGGPSVADILEAFEGDERLVSLRREDVVGRDILDVGVKSGVARSKSAARKLLTSGGFYLNNRKLPSTGYTVTESDLLDDSLCLLRTGKNNYIVVRVV